MSEFLTHPLKAWRDGFEPRMTQGALGESVGVGAAQISMIEKGRRSASVEVASKIADVTKGAVPLDCLFVPRKKRRVKKRRAA